MKRSSIVVAVLFLTLRAASARDDLTTLKGFEHAFRHAHATANTDYFDPLVYWYATSPEMKLNMYEALAKGFHRIIAHIEVVPFAPSPERFAAPYHPNVQPTHVFLVWYADDVGQPPFSVRYFITKKNGKLQFVVPENPTLRMYNLL
ncbi:MAG: hypothetical protein QOI04_257 [Verrucomicrobiota bacterium]|jgi:hypothetical protein